MWVCIMEYIIEAIFMREVLREYMENGQFLIALNLGTSTIICMYPSAH